MSPTARHSSALRPPSSPREAAFVGATLKPDRRERFALAVVGAEYLLAGCRVEPMTGDASCARPNSSSGCAGTRLQPTKLAGISYAGRRLEKLSEDLGVNYMLMAVRGPSSSRSAISG